MDCGGLPDRRGAGMPGTARSRHANLRILADLGAFYPPARDGLAAISRWWQKASVYRAEGAASGASRGESAGSSRFVMTAPDGRIVARNASTTSASHCRP